MGFELLVELAVFEIGNFCGAEKGAKRPVRRERSEPSLYLCSLLAVRGGAACGRAEQRGSKTR